MGMQAAKKQGHRPSGSPAGSGGQFDEVRRDAVDIDLAQPQPFSREHILANVDRWQTDEGYEELVGLVDQARALVEQLKEDAETNLPSMRAFSAWYDTPQRKHLDNAEHTLRSIERARSQNALADLARSASYPPDVASALEKEAKTRPTRQRVQDSNGNWRETTVLGSVTVTEPFRVRQQYETAAWFRDHEVKPGTYPVWLTGDRIGVGYDTTVVDEDFTPLLHGVPNGRSRKDGIGTSDRFGQNVEVHTMPGVYAPGIRVFGGHLALRQGVDLRRKPVAGVSGLSLLTKVDMPDDVERLPDAPNEFRKRWYG